MSATSKVLVIGLDGLEPSIVEAMLQAGELPNLARLRHRGGYSRLATTTPAQTPVAWSSFATGTNPGGHGIFDFLRRDPESYTPDLGLSRFEQANPFLPPTVTNLRGGVALWDVLTAAGVPSTILRCPCTFPPAPMHGRLLAGMGVPDIRGGLGTSTFFTTDPFATAREGEQLVPLAGSGATSLRARLPGPRTGRRGDAATFDFELEVDAVGRTARVASHGRPHRMELREGEWSDWLRVKFKVGVLRAVAGVVRFLLVRVAPHVELYASPVNFDPRDPLFDISYPPAYAGQLASELGADFYTAGMVEDHTGLSNGRFSEEEFLAQCDLAFGEREAMLQHELARLDEGLLFCLFDTPDRLQHMFWRFREPGHPANRERPARCAELARVVEDHYVRCDALLGRTLEAVSEDALCIVLSDHGFHSFQRGVHLNRVLQERGFLALSSSVDADAGGADFFRHVDWGQTQAYALGFGSIYLNIRDREGAGIVPAADADRLAATLAASLAGLTDLARGTVAITSARTRREVYSGPFAHESPDVMVNFNRGYRASWSTALGGMGHGLFEDNVRPWGGDHIIDPLLAPGVLFMNQPFAAAGARLIDLAPTILAALGAPVPPAMEGKNLRGHL
ncbi:MAG: alkaline phosphatase family protein [Gemmatimonadaceae bacterium]